MKVVLSLITLLYPLVIFYGLAEFSVRWVSFLLLLLFLIRLLLLKKSNTSENNLAKGKTFKKELSKKSDVKHHGSDNLPQQMLGPVATKVLAALVFALLLASITFDVEIGLLFYPVVINSALAIVFLYSLSNPPPVIERLARLTQSDLPEHAIAYTRTVTKVWLVFFIVNGLVAAYTALFTSLATWTLYNGLIAYLLMGALFTVEYLVRLRVQKRYDS